MQGFLSVVRLEIVRRNPKWTLDSAIQTMTVTSIEPDDINKPPQQGVYLHDLYLKGASWNPVQGVLQETQRKVSIGICISALDMAVDMP